MKLAFAKGVNGRGQMRERHRRDRAATAVMSVRFPQFTSLRLDFDFSDGGPFTPAPQVTVMHPPARAFFSFPCPYVDCDGEFDLSAVVATLAQEQDRQCTGELRCCGQRAGNKGRTPCQLTLAYTIEAQRG